MQNKMHIHDRFLRRNILLKVFFYAKLVFFGSDLLRIGSFKRSVDTGVHYLGMKLFLGWPVCYRQYSKENVLFAFWYLRDRTAML